MRRPRFGLGLLILFILLLVSSSAFAQSFTKADLPVPSEYDTVVGTQAVVTKVEVLTVKQTDTGTILTVQDVCNLVSCGTGTKPAQAAGVIPNVPLVTSPKNVVLEIATRFTGPGGPSLLSPFSDGFSFLAAPSPGGKPLLKP